MSLSSSPDEGVTALPPREALRDPTASQQAGLLAHLPHGGHEAQLTLRGLSFPRSHAVGLAWFTGRSDPKPQKHPDIQSHPKLPKKASGASGTGWMKINFCNLVF